MLIGELFNNPIYFLAACIAIFISIILHELAHGFVAIKCGDYTPKMSGRMTLNPLKHFDIFGTIMMLTLGFGFAKPMPINSYNFRKPRKGIVLTSLAGVTMNLILAFIFCPLSILCANGMLFATSEAVMWIFYFLTAFTSFMVSINLFLFVFNLLPIFPLDGFRLIEGLSRNPYNKFCTFMRKYGFIFFFVILALACFGTVFQIPELNFINYIGTLIEIPLFKFWRLFF